MTLYTQVAANKTRTFVFMLLYVVLLMAIGYFASWYFGNRSILFLAGVIALVQGLVSYYASDSIALMVAKAVPLEREGNERIYRIVENLCVTAGLQTPRLFVIPDMAINAFATGRDQAHAALALTAGLIEQMDDNELAGVIAHELSHVGNEDIKLMSMISIMAGVIALLSDWLLRSSIFGRRGRDDNGSGATFLIIAVVLAILAPIASALIQLAISRKREFMADGDAVLLTRYPEGLISALRKLEGDTEVLASGNRATAHMYIVNPLRKGFWANLFSTHPPIEERIAALEKGSGL